MSMHFQRQIEQLKKMILSLGARVEQVVQQAIESIQLRDPVLAKAVIDGDAKIDLMEVEIEEECLHALALHQPVAFDLRYVVATLKINNELERIGDLAVNIAEQAIHLASEPELDLGPFDLNEMCRLVRAMLRDSLNALVGIDAKLAQQVRVVDDQVDAIHRRMYDKVERAIREQVHQTPQHIHLLSVSRNLERTADHAVNIAEDVLYMAEGGILRHHRSHPLLNPTGAGE